MEIIIIGLILLQSISISLGVGSSTIAISQFFVSLADGTIDNVERQLLGVVYIVLRIAMVVILFTTIALTVIEYSYFGNEIISPFFVAFWTLIIVLFTNAVLMTTHVMPSTFGPSLQAASWYTMGIIMTFSSSNLVQFTFFQFIIGYMIAITVAVILVNGIMKLLKRLTA